MLINCKWPSLRKSYVVKFGYILPTLSIQIFFWKSSKLNDFFLEDRQQILTISFFLCSRLSKDDIWRWLIACRIFFNIQSLAHNLFLVTSYCTYSSTCTIVLCFNRCLFFDRIISRMFSTLWSEQRYWLCTVQLLFLSVFVFWDVNIIIVF